MEALRHGDGHAISPGDSDWTTTVDPVSWAHCRLVDTPGIEGWGRTMSRRDLEEQAREELVTADIVILCFDTQNQKAGEFRKVAAWIAEYRKPVVAVLNVRPPNWRFPTRVPRRAVRQRSSQTVAEHATHIREGLTRDRPDRHADHRAQQPASGLRPGPQAILGARRSSWRPCWPIAREGIDELLKWSNLPLLERLLVTAVEDGAAQLRRGVLLNQLVRTLDRMRTERIPRPRPRQRPPPSRPRPV